MTLENIDIENGRAKVEVTVTKEVTVRDVRAVVDHVRSTTGAKGVDIDTGWIVNDVLDAKFSDRVAQGRPVFGSKIEKGGYKGGNMVSPSIFDAE